MTAKRLVDNGKWVYWLAGLVAVMAAGAVSLNRIAIGKTRDDLCPDIKQNRDDIADIREWKGGAQKDLEYTAQGIKRLEQHFQTLPDAKK